MYKFQKFDNIPFRAGNLFTVVYNPSHPIAKEGVVYWYEPVELINGKPDFYTAKLRMDDNIKKEGGVIHKDACRLMEEFTEWETVTKFKKLKTQRKKQPSEIGEESFNS